MAGQNIGNTRDQAAETAISASNASQLTQKWALTTAGDVTATPTMVNNVLYFPDMGGMLWAVTSAGKVLWSNPVSSYTGITGDVSRDSPAIDGNELITGRRLGRQPHRRGRARVRPEPHYRQAAVVGSRGQQPRVDRHRLADRL